MLSECTTLLILLTLLTGCASSLRGPANIFYSDDREYLPKDGKLPIGTILRDPKKNYDWGTGFQIDACHVVTNYHVIRSEGREHSEDFRVFFSDQPGKFVKARLLLSGRPDLLEDQSVASTSRRDWALLKLEDCQAKDFYFTLTTLSKEQLPMKHLQMLGFPDDIGDKSIALDPDCEIRTETAKGLHHVCASRPGSSGSPIYFEEDGEWFVVAINVSQRSDFREIISGYSDWISNGAVNPSSYLEPIQSYLKEQELTAPIP